MNHYELVAKVIRYLDQHHVEQPELSELAAHVGLSPAHFHRLFVRWAGITPKDFLQCLTLVRVKAALREGRTILDASLDAGLSGPGRLHDLCVSLEAASPGEIKSGGAEWTITAGFAECPFGTCLIAASPRGVCHLAFVEAEDMSAAWQKLKEDWPNANLLRNDAVAVRRSRMIFKEVSRGNTRSGLRIYVRGTPFQVRVWRALANVPPGHLITYGQLAQAVGAPSAARAVGSAVGANSLAYLIPCHRVIRETGVVGEYRWGRIRKRALVAWESASRLALTPATTRV